MTGRVVKGTTGGLLETDSFTYDSNGNVSKSTSTEIVSAQHRWFHIDGYVGPRPKPLVPHAFEAYHNECTGTFRDFRRYKDTGRLFRDIHGPFLARGGPTATISFDPVPDWNLAYNKCLDELAEKARGSLDLSVDLAEIGKTRSMLSATKRVEDYTKVFWRRWTTTKAFANHWLEYTYGLKPLVSSVFGLAEENARVVINKVESFKARGTDYSFTPKRIRIEDKYGFEWYPVDKCRFKLSTTIGCDLTSQVFDAARFSSLNPASIAWELLPYSFVVDWFCDVGGYLRNLETALLYGGRFRNGYKTELAVFEGSFFQNVDYDYYGVVPGGFQEVRGQFSGSHIKRSLLGEYPHPNRPSFQARLGSSRLLSAAALLGQQLGHTPRSKVVWTLEQQLASNRKDRKLAVRR